MINQSNWQKYSVPIDSIVEVRLCQETWSRIQLVARARNTTYSRVVRYSLFRLINRANVNRYLAYDLEYQLLNPTAALHYDRIQRRARKKRIDHMNHHRHRLCLYGEDELFLRLTAARLRCTMSHLIRVGLELYLDKLVASTRLSAYKRFLYERRTHRSFWFWLGFKLYIDVELPTCRPAKQHFKFKKFPKHAYF